MRSNFEFLQEKFPFLANDGKLAELYCYSDPNSCLIKLGMMAEHIINLIFKYDDIPLPRDNTPVNRIDALFTEELLTRDLVDAFHALRKIRNKATHENYSSVEDAKTMLQMTHGICEWFMQTYGDWDYQNQPFIMPEEIVGRDDDIKADEAEESRLYEEAAKAATVSTHVDKNERRKQSYRAANQRPRTETETRYLIDEQLRRVGWEADTQNLRYSNGCRPTKGRNMAIAEWPTDSNIGNAGYADYALFIGTKLVGIIEAKASHKDIPSIIDYQCKEYSSHIRTDDSKYQIDTWGKYQVPFTFATNGRPYLEQYKIKSGIWFLDLRRSDNIPKVLHGWMSPEGIEKLLEKDIDANNKELKALPYDMLRDKDGLNLRDYQIRAIQAAENAVMLGKHEILIAMATGTGKTRTALGMIYRFLKSNRFSRILFLVDRNPLGKQAIDKFNEVKLEDLKTLNEIYNIKKLTDKSIDKETRVHVATVQSMVRRILYGSEDTMPSVSDYDLVIVDEAHRGYILDRELTEDEVYYRDQLDYQSKYRAVIEYFDAVKIALTATPALQTTKIFGAPVFRYSYAEAVIDGYLVDTDAPHKLTTKLSQNGIHYKVGDTVTFYDTATGEVTDSELLDDELDFDVEKFNRQVITEPFNRAVLEEIARCIDPENPEEQGKTLVFAVNDSHADLIVSILKEIYSKTGVDNDAIMKITGSVGDEKRIERMINRFKNERYPSIVVTVDLLTTGIDVPEITNLVFMRRVKSRILYEQMKGRATRPCPKLHKTHYEIYDPVGVCKSLENVDTMKPVVVDPSTSFTQLLDGLEIMDDDDKIQKQVVQIIAKLQRKKYRMDSNTKEQFMSMTNGLTADQFIADIKQRKPADAKNHLLANRELFCMLDQYHYEGNHRIVISHKEDVLLGHDRYYESTDKPEDYLQAFSEFITTHINEIAALNIICTRPKDLTRGSLKSLRLELERAGYTEQFLNTANAQATNKEITADIISYIRRYALGSTLVPHEARIRQAVEKLKNTHNFSRQEISWIDRMEKYLLEENVLNVDVFDEDGRFKEKGGFEKINKVFGNKLESIITELNDYLYDDGGDTA